MFILRSTEYFWNICTAAQCIYSVFSQCHLWTFAIIFCKEKCLEPKICAKKHTHSYTCIFEGEKSTKHQGHVSIEFGWQHGCKASITSVCERTLFSSICFMKSLVCMRLRCDYSMKSHAQQTLPIRWWLS